MAKPRHKEPAPEDDDEVDDEDIVQFSIELERLPRSEIGPCDHCAIDLWEDDVLFLNIQLSEANIALCPTHEGELLQRLLSNYVKRRGKTRPGGFVGDLVKEPSGEA